MAWDDVPGLIGVEKDRGETTLFVDKDQLVEACEHLRDNHGFNFLSDITPTDYLGWPTTTARVAGYYGSTAGRDINAPGSWGLASLPAEKPKRFSVNYHLLSLVEGAPRLRVQVWVDDGEVIPSVIGVWPTADWHEREAWDMMGIPVEGHPNLVRILMEDDWEGHPLRKDYPLGGEPVRFSEEE